MIWQAAAIIVLANLLDPYRDKWSRDADWQKRHRAKWLAFYPFQIAAVVLLTPWWSWPLFAIGAWIVWQIGKHVFGVGHWSSYWWQKLKELWERLWRGN